MVLDFAALRAKFQPADIESRADPSLWRYLPLLPVAEIPGSMTPLHVAGGTPVYSLGRLGERTGLEQRLA